MTFVSRNHGIFTFFAKFYVRCRKWRRKEGHIRRKRKCHHPHGFFSTFLFGISLLFWNIFGVYATSGVTTMSNINNVNSTKFNKDSTNDVVTAESLTTLQPSSESCDYTHNSTITTTNGSIDLLTTENTIDDYNFTITESSTSDPCSGDIDFNVCNFEFKDRTTLVCNKTIHNFTCVSTQLTSDGIVTEFCPARKCLDRSIEECKSCLCEVKQKNIEIHLRLETFKTILARVDCERRYSMWNCNDCVVVYRDWMCSTSGQYSPLKPCLDVCTSVMSRCPYLVPSKLYGGSPSFSCPELSEVKSNDSYAMAGEKCFTCAESSNYNVLDPCQIEVIHDGINTPVGSAAGIVYTTDILLICLLQISVYIATTSYS